MQPSIWDQEREKAASITDMVDKHLTVHGLSRLTAEYAARDLGREFIELTERIGAPWIRGNMEQSEQYLVDRLAARFAAEIDSLVPMVPMIRHCIMIAAAVAMAKLSGERVTCLVSQRSLAGTLWTNRVKRIMCGKPDGKLLLSANWRSPNDLVSTDEPPRILFFVAEVSLEIVISASKWCKDNERPVPLFYGMCNYG